MKLSESIRTTDVVALTEEQLLKEAVKWADKAAEQEELLLRARDELVKYTNVICHPTPRSLVAKKDKQIVDLQVRMDVLTKKAQLYYQTAEAWKEKYEQIRLERQRNR